MPKGSSLARNVRRLSEEIKASELLSRRNQPILTLEDPNENVLSDEEGSRYSYEETDEDVEKSVDDPSSTAGDSPEALDINSLLQLNTKSPSKAEDVRNVPRSVPEVQTPSLSLRKTGQVNVLKPIQSAKKKPPKVVKTTQQLDEDTARRFNRQISDVTQEQKLTLQRIREEWAAVVEKAEKEEKDKYERWLKDGAKRLEEDEQQLRKSHSERLSQVKLQLEEQTRMEQKACEDRLSQIKLENESKYALEVDNYQKKIYSLKTEMEKIELEKSQIVAVSAAPEDTAKEIDNLKLSHKKSLKCVQEAHRAQVADIEKKNAETIAHLQKSLEESAQKVTEQNAECAVNSSKLKELDSEMDRTRALLKAESEKHQQLLMELDKLKTEISNKKESLATLDEKTTAAQTNFEEIQDEVDKTENDLDLLREEKNILISEISVLKNKINKNNSKINASPKKAPTMADSSTSTGICTLTNNSSQTCVESRNASCQHGRPECSKRDRCCQTEKAKNVDLVDGHCQVELLKPVAMVENVQKEMASDREDSTSINRIVGKFLENAMAEVSDKMEARFKSIEELVVTIQKNTAFPENANPTNNSTRITELNSLHSKCHLIPSGQKPNTTLSLPSRTSHLKTCGCAGGGACDIMNDVKSSVYRMNDILSTSFSSPVTSCLLPSFRQTDYSSTIDGFYAQLRHLQDKQRASDLKNRLSDKFSSTGPKSLSYLSDYDYRSRRSPNWSNISMAPPLPSAEDPIARARSLMIREQARTWKQQQQLLSSIDNQLFLQQERNSLSDNTSPSPLSRVSSGFSEGSTPLPFLKFEPDPELEYNEWMSKFKVLQDKIRSHRLI